MERTLLFIDPDPATRLLVERVLSPEGFSVLHAETALEGQEYAARILPDLILVDVDRARAADLVPALRRCPGLERVRLLASTAHAWPDHLEKMLALGFDRAFVEPLDIDTLAQELRECLPGSPAAANGAGDGAANGAGPIASAAHAGGGSLLAAAARSNGGHAIEMPASGNALDEIETPDELDAGDALDSAGAVESIHALDPSDALGAPDKLDEADAEAAAEAPIVAVERADASDVPAALDTRDVAAVTAALDGQDVLAATFETRDGVDAPASADPPRAAIPTRIASPPVLEASASVAAADPIDVPRAADRGEEFDHRSGIDQGHGPDPAAEGAEPIVRREPEDVARAAGAGAATVPPARAGALEPAPLEPVALEPMEVPSLWRLGLTPLTAALVRATGAADGLLALLDDQARVLVIVAGASSRQVDDGTPIDAGVPIGTRVLVGATPWIAPALAGRDATVLTAEVAEPSPLVPAGSQALLIVPVASRDKVHGLAVLGKSHATRAAVFGSGKIAAGLSQGRQLAGAVEVLRELDRTSGERRRALERLRVDSARAVLRDVTARTRRSRRNGAGADPAGPAGDDAADRLGAALAERLGLSARQRGLLAQALPVRDIGRDWLERVLLARTTLSIADRARMLEASAEHGAEILIALGWPPAVVKLVRVHRASWNGAGWPAGLSGSAIPMEARVMAVVSAFVAAAARRAGEDEAAVVRDVLAELGREAGRRYDPCVIDALTALALPDEALTLKRG